MGFFGKLLGEAKEAKQKVLGLYENVSEQEDPAHERYSQCNID